MTCRSRTASLALAACLLTAPVLSFAEEKLMWYGPRSADLEVPGRLIPSEDGSTIKIGYNACRVTITFTEKPRKTRIEQDLSALLSKIKILESTPCDMDEKVAEYTPQLKVSTVTVTALDPAGKRLASQEIAWGPTEHLSLSVDLPVSNRKTLKYDEASHSLKPKDDKAQVYLGINYSLGDVIRSDTVRDRTDIKVMILASKRPLDSYGVGVGHRLSALNFLGKELKGLSLFAGYFTTRQDKIEAGAPQENEGRTKQWRVGVSYDLSTGGGLLKF